MKIKNHAQAHSLPQQTIKYIDHRCVETSKTVGLSFQDEEDLKQQMYLYAIKALEHYDQDRKAKLETFLHAVVDNAAKQFLRSRMRMKNRRVACILDAPVEGESAQDGGDEMTLLDTIADESAAWLDEYELRSDIAAFLATLGKQQKTVCRLVMANVPYVEISRRIGVPEWKIRQQILPGLAPVLAKFLNS